MSVQDRPIDWAVSAVEVAGALMVLSGIAVAIIRIVKVPFMKERPPLAALQIRLGLGLSLTLGLEFLLAADILRTAISPTYDDIAQLAAIAAIRTALNYFIGRELIEGERQIAVLRSAPLHRGMTEAPTVPLRSVRGAGPAATEAPEEEAAVPPAVDGSTSSPRRRLRDALGTALKGPLALSRWPSAPTPAEREPSGPRSDDDDAS